MPQYRTIAAFLETADPTAPERDLIAACLAGEECNLGDTRPAGPDPTRTIRADLLRLLITGGSTDCGLADDGVWLEGAWITGELNLRFARARGRTVLDACHFTDQPYLTQAHLQQLSLDGCHLPGLFAQGMVIKGSVYLRNLHATGTVDVNAAQIGGQLVCTGAELDGKDGRALNAQGVTTGQSLFLSNLHATGMVDVNGAQIGGQLSCAGAVLDGKDGRALHAQGVTTGQDLFLSNLHATGIVDVNGAQIGGQLDCDGAVLDGKDGTALLAQRLRVEQGFIWREVTVTKGRVDLTAAHVSDLSDDITCWPTGADQLGLDGFTYDRIDSTSPTDATRRLRWLENGAVFKGTLSPQPYTQLAKVLSDMGHERDARDVRMAFKQRSAAHDRNLDRALFKLARAFRRFSARRDKNAFNKLTVQRNKTPAPLADKLEQFLERFMLLHLPLPTPANAPEPVDDLTRAFAQQDFRNRMRSAAIGARLRIGWSWTSDVFLRWTVGYGYAPHRSIFCLIGLFVAATFLASLAWNEGSFAPNSDVVITSQGWQQYDTMDCYPKSEAQRACDANPANTWSSNPVGGLDWDSFNRYGYAADLVIPILDLGQTDAWAPSKDRGPWGWWLWWLRWVLSGLGWIVTGLGAAAVTGIIKRDRG